MGPCSDVQTLIRQPSQAFRRDRGFDRFSTAVICKSGRAKEAAACQKRPEKLCKAGYTKSGKVSITRWPSFTCCPLYSRITCVHVGGRLPWKHWDLFASCGWTFDGEKATFELDTQTFGTPNDEAKTWKPGSGFHVKRHRVSESLLFSLAGCL